MTLSPAERETKDAIRSGSVLLSGGYAWAATVLPVAGRGAAPGAGAAASMAALSLVAGCSLARRRPVLARALALHVFAACSLLAWVLATSSISVEHLDPARGAFGSLAWLLFALAWGVPREPARIPEEAPNVLPGEGFSPREAARSRTSVAMAAGIAGAALPLVAAFTVARREHALFAHAAAAGLSIVVLTVGARIATAPPAEGGRPPAARRLSAALVPLALLLLLLVAGLVGRAGR